MHVSRSEKRKDNAEEREEEICLETKFLGLKTRLSLRSATFNPFRYDNIYNIVLWQKTRTLRRR